MRKKKKEGPTKARGDDFFGCGLSHIKKTNAKKKK